MRILTVVGKMDWAKTDARNNIGPEVVMGLEPYLYISTGETLVDFVSVHEERDTDRLRGLRYDYVVEHFTYNPDRTRRKGDLLDLIRIIVLR